MTRAASKTLKRLQPAAPVLVMRTVPVAEWGKDHWSLLAYVETRCVDYQGVLELIRMRCNPKRHAWLNGAPRGSFSVFNADGSYMYPTMLKGVDTQEERAATGKACELVKRKLEPEHDDFDCFNDLINAGLIMDIGTGIHPVAKLTPTGLKTTAALRAWKAGGNTFATFPGA